MVTHDLMVKIIELRHVEKRLNDSCQEDCQNCRDIVKSRINELCEITGEDVIVRSSSIKNYDMMIQIQELNELEKTLCTLCREICGECKAEIQYRIRRLCKILFKECSKCNCDEKI